MNKVCIIFGLIVLVSVFSPRVYPQPDLAAVNDEQQQKAVAQGIADAEHDFKRGVYRIEVYGLRGTSKSPEEEYLEEKYRIKTDPVAGCIVDTAILGHAEGYNKRMKKLLLKKYGKDIFEEAKTAGAVVSKATERKPENLTMTLAWIADSEKPDAKEYVFVINGLVAYKTLDGLKRYIKGLPKGSSVTWAPGCDRIGNEPLLSSEKDMREFEKYCESYGIKLIIIPSG